MAVGQESVIADALETRRQGMLQETADELLGRDGHHLLLLCGRPLDPVIFPGEGDLTVFQLEQAAIGNGHSMGVAAQIFQYALRPAKGSLGVHHPLGLAQGSQITGEGRRIAQPLQIAEELQLALGVGLL